MAIKKINISATNWSIELKLRRAYVLDFQNIEYAVGIKNIKFCQLIWRIENLKFNRAQSYCPLKWVGIILVLILWSMDSSEESSLKTKQK